MPKVDDHNDWTLLVAMEFALSGKTVLRFSRALNTCDDEDYPIGVSICFCCFVLQFKLNV